MIADWSLLHIARCLSGAAVATMFGRCIVAENSKSPDSASATSPPADSNAALTPVEAPYLLAVGIPCYIDTQGRRWLDELWHKDIVEHLRYLKDFTLACPASHAGAPPAAVCLDEDERFEDVRYVHWKATDGFLSGVLGAFAAAGKLWKPIGKSTVVHVGLVNWPVPIGWPATLITKLRGKLLLTYIESAFWRVSDPAKATFRERVRAAVWEKMNRWCVNKSDLNFFTQETYREQMLKDPTRGHVLSASWIDESIVLSQAQAASLWDLKRGHPAPNILFAARMLAEKGVYVLVEALDILRQRGVALTVHAIGVGPMFDDLRAATARNDDRVTLSVHDPIPYMPDFFHLMRRFEAVIMPSLSDEQPRLVYDALSQAVPVLASNTPGIAAVLRDGVDGKLFSPGSADALADALEWAASNRAELRVMGMAGLSRAAGYTHQEMHRRRWQVISAALENKSGFGAKV